MPLEFDDADWPIGRVTPIGQITDREFDDWLTCMNVWVARGSHVVILDTRRNERVKYDHLKRMGSWLREVRARAPIEVGTVMVMDNPFMRAAASFVFKLAPNVQGYRACAELQEAERLARELLREQGSERR